MDGSFDSMKSKKFHEKKTSFVNVYGRKSEKKNKKSKITETEREETFVVSACSVYSNVDNLEYQEHTLTLSK